MRARPAFRRLAVSTVALTYLLIVWGGIVRVSGSGNGCGTQNQWPLCNGSLLPALRTETLIEFTHRWLAALATILVIILTVAAWWWQRRDRRIVVATSVAAALFVLQIALGAVTVEYNLPGGVVMIHLANALLLLGVLVYVAVVSTAAPVARRAPGGTAAAAGPLDRLIPLAVASTYVLTVSGALVVETNSGAGCDGWPLCGGGLQLPAGQAATLNMVHRVIAGLVVLLLGATMALVRRRHAGDTRLRAAAMLVNLLLVAQVAVGALVVELRLPAGVRALHIALASALWAAMVGVAVLRAQGGGAPSLDSETARRDPLPPRARVAPL